MYASCANDCCSGHELVISTPVPGHQIERSEARNLPPPTDLFANVR